jgi:hypothetical protein
MAAVDDCGLKAKSESPVEDDGKHPKIYRVITPITMVYR